MDKRMRSCYKWTIAFVGVALFCLLPFNGGIGQIRKDISPVTPAPSKAKPYPEIRPQEPPKFSIPPGIESFTAEPRTLNYGEEVTLKWRFRSSYAGDLRVAIEGVQMKWISMSIAPQWRVVSKSSDPSRVPDLLEGSYTFRPKGIGYTDFKIKISHVMPGGVVFKSFEETTRGRGITINCFNLKIKSEVIQDPEPKVNFYVENKPSEYSASYNGSLKIEYHILSLLPSPGAPIPLAIKQSHDFGNVNLAPGEKAPPVEVRLKKEAAFATEGISVKVWVKWNSPYPGEGEQKIGTQLTHQWIEKQGNLGAPLIIGVVNEFLKNLKFRIHNYQRQESYVELPNWFKQSFDIPEISRRLSFLGMTLGYYRIWIRDINNAPFGQDPFSIAEGGIKVNIPIESGGSTEIKCAYDPVGPAGADDNACPDVDLHGPINAKVIFSPAIVDGKLGYSHVNVDLTIAGINLTNVWDWFIQLFSGNIKPKIEGATEKALKDFFENQRVKNIFMDAIKRYLMGDVTRITRIEVRGNELLYWYF